ncbi:MAG: UbiH/UbiF/VisC/COQ6 family ubiquinone biosynthesis hydroxylase [Gammaproteobacteria bacterium]|nr:UbiH/UbiF/VisC/COQ6 family ubiquinone biosynthesis hydroxylase [Gammaproteobacteria bacterium]
MKDQYDIIIIGGGMVGLTLACALGQQQFKVAVVEAYAPEDIKTNDDYELRVSAISKSSQQILQNVNAWQAMLKRRVCSYQHMHVWDATGDGSIHFDAADLGLDSIGHIIENKVIQFSLLEQCLKLPDIDWLCPQKVTEINFSETSQQVLLESGDTLNAKLLIGADGANSKVREAAAIEIDKSAYEQKAIVAIVKSSLHHKNTAWQRFLPTGPLAFLPLSDGSCSIVWSAENKRADELIEMDEELFITELQSAFENTLGKVESVSRRAAFPLIRRHANEYVKQGLALLGDAAHTIHPLAGQGVNLGLLDAAALAEVIIKARSQGKSISSLTTLRRYERWRRADNSLMMASMSGFKNLFSNEQSELSLLRNAGLNIVNNMGPVKNKLMRHALGLEGDLPEMAKSIGW